MDRRTFLGSSAALGVAGAAPAKEDANQYIELTFIQMRNDRDNQRRRLNTFLQEEHLPMTKRAGIGPVGYFQVWLGPDTPKIITVAAYDSLAGIQEKHQRAMADKNYMKAIEAASADGIAMYDRAERWLLRGFDAHPKVTPLAVKEGQKPRFFDLRIYESVDVHSHLRKVEMFNSGEIPIFEECGINPVMFGQTLYGGQLPNLAYMVCYDDWAAREKAWAAFRDHPDWKKMQKNPRWAGTVSNITNTFLEPLPFSPIR